MGMALPGYALFTDLIKQMLTSYSPVHRIAAGIAMSSLQITALGIGPLTAYVVDLFPTTLR